VNNKVSRRVVARTIAAKLLGEPSQRSHWLKVTAAYLIDQHMVDDIDLFINDLAQELHKQSGHLFVDVTSAHKLTDAVRVELKHTLQGATGARHIELAEHVDPTLLGGLIARTPDAELDASVRTKLKQLASL
jgi:F-type H+-transporting ATPase subunit delta